MKSLAVSERDKKLDLEDFFNIIHVRNDQLILIKKSIIQLFRELVENKIIQNEVEILLKSDKSKDLLIKNVNTFDITRQIKYVQFHKIFRKSV